MRNSKDQTFDASLQLKDAGAVTASGNAQVGGSAKILNVGLGRYDGRVIIDVDAIDTTSGDESYRLRLQGSTDSGFASGVQELAALELGDSSVSGDTVDDPTGRRELPFTNEVNGVLYPYLRISYVIAGTTPSINFRAYLAQLFR